MSGIERYRSVFSLFSEEKNRWTAAEISAALNIPASTVYRTIRELARVRMLEQARDGNYRLGSAFVELDRMARLTDPLVRAGVPMLPEIAQQAGIPCVVVLARLHGETVMCVADLHSTGSKVQTSYERGRPRPLTRGATSKVILAQLKTRQLNKLLAATPAADSQQDLRAELARIRKQGYCVTHGEVDAGRVGVALPISVPQEPIIASISIVADEASLTPEIERHLRVLLERFASSLEAQLSDAGASA